MGLNTFQRPVCRLCAQSQDQEKFTFIFSDDENEENLADIINISLPVKVSQMDSLPKQICDLCLEKVQATHEFALSCLTAQQELKDHCDQQKFRLCDLPEVRFLGHQSTPVEEDETVSVGANPPRPCGIQMESHQPMQEDVLNSTNAFGNDESLAKKYQCRLCCEGDMSSCFVEPIELFVQSKVSPTRSFEEELLTMYHKANHEDDSSTSVVEDDYDLEVGSKQIEIATESKSSNFHEVEATYPKVKTKSKHIRVKKRGRVAKHFKVKSLSQSPSKDKGDPDESDTLIWIKADNEQSIPLVQCIHCSGWLPGYASCLQHSLTSHIDVDEVEEKTYHCARCEGVSVTSSSDLISHFKSVHCPNLDFEVEEDNGQFSVNDKCGVKSLPTVEVSKDLSYFCCICEKGFSWLLNLLQHTCSKVNCNSMYCNICNQEYRNRQRFVFHMNFHTEGAPRLECDVCNESFADDCLLYNHVRFGHSTENFECSECGKLFRSDKGLASHQMTAHNSDPSSQNRPKCTVCGKCYRDKQGLKEHIVTHMSVKPFPCDKCDRAYNRYSRLKQHQLSHVYTDTMECFECVNCGLAFPDVDKALSHSTSEEHEVQGTLLNKIYRCEFCDTVFSCPDGLNLHRPSHIGDKPFVCHICGASFHTYARVTTHKTTHGIYDQIEPQEGDFTIPRHFLCEHCGVSYPYWSYLQTHRKMRHSENPFSLSCKLCPEKFQNSWSAVYHRRKVHDQNGSVKEWRKRTLQCPHCGVNCMYQHSLSMHIERKHGSSKDEDGKRESYQCEECGKVFKYQSSLLLHQKMHQGQKNFQCEECEKAFLTIATLRNHTRRCHQGIKPHQCEFCGKAFFHRVTRDDHLRVHTGEKPFKCEFCDKRFRLKSMLTDHSKIHNDHRPYPCDVCGSSFRRMVHMKQHRMLHTGEKPFQCRYCGQDFRLKQELQRHMKTKHGESAIDTVEDDEFMFGDS